MKKFIIIGGIGVVVIVIVLIALSSSGGNVVLPKKVDLTIWGVFDEESSYQDLIATYHTLHPYVNVTYKKFRIEEYEDILISSWARGIGPDIFLVPNYWLGKYKDFSTPMPKTTKMAYYSTVKTLGIKEETKVEYRELPTVSMNALQNNFIDAVASDVVFDQQIYGLPLSADTLVLFYNKDLLNKAGFPLPPRTWSEFVKMVEKMTILDDAGNIVQSGAALGTYENIPRAFDILSLLMIQNGTEMVDVSGKRVTFGSASPSDPTYIPGQEALRFYTDFSSPTKQVYTWNTGMPNALDSFSQGSVAFFLGYAFHIPLIEERATQLKYSISFVPQIAANQEVNYANYWIMSAAKASSHTNEAWNFIQYAASEEAVSSYLNKAGRVSVLRSLLSTQINDPESNVYIFAKQALNAKSWYHGKDPAKAEEAFKNMIETVVNGTADYETSLGTAAKVIDLTLQTP